MRVTTEHPFFGYRFSAASLVVSLAFVIIGLRLWYLQCLWGSYYRNESENNRTRAVRILPPRGSIYDRGGRGLVLNRPAFNVALMVEDIPNLEQTLKDISDISGRESETIQTNRARQKSRKHFEPKVIMSDVTREELAKIKANSYRLPGVIVEVLPARAYPDGTLGAQLFGYAREINKKQLEELRGVYRSGDIVGQSGLEQQWQEYLRGQTGSVQVEVDAMGHRRGELGIADSKAGKDLYLTIDRDLQRVAEEGLAGKKGAVVVVDPRNGEILALASAPSFDANLFSGAMLPEDWQQVSNDKARPLTNRAISQAYPAGSTFKLIMTVAALAHKKISPQTQFNCPGYYLFKGRPYHCHKQSGHGTVDLRRAFTVSCNTYFYQVGQHLGISLIHETATQLGLGERTGIDLPNEEKGIIPSEEWKEKLYGEPWYAGETLSVSIGQGFVTVTPLQMAMAVSIIANGGKSYRPMLVRKVEDPNTGESREFKQQLVRTVPIDPEVFSYVRSIATEVVNHPEGTGHKAALQGITVGGKTGTAQVASLARGGSEESEDHAWFVAFAPAENPTIALAIVVEHGGHGGSVAAPISKQIMEAYFQKQGLLPDILAAPENDKLVAKVQPSVSVKRGNG